ncbi:unnamed protein product [Durusdinium trenchii]|uniref:Palmitoyltransferase n=1 Tax=Durusdinium trenchii TaxID=1381693 RepID=A0ABP0SZQ7_9DINO
MPAVELTARAAAAGNEEETQNLITGRVRKLEAPTPECIGSKSGDLEEQIDRGKLVRLYEQWPSKNIFCCWGLLMTGGSDDCFCPNICVWCFILVPCALYFGLVAPSLVAHGIFLLPGATLAVFCTTTGLLLCTCCTDPGIIPRREVVLATGSAEQLRVALGYDVLGEEGEGTISQKLRKEGFRLCNTCSIIRPPRASHCSDCDNCVMRYDHHCPFVNNCVGQRNYHYFFGFISCVLVLALMVLPALALHLLNPRQERAIRNAAKIDQRMSFFFYFLIGVGVLVAFAAFLSLLLWAYHLFLIVTKQTTKEFRRGLANIDEEPTLCAARGPQLFDPWAWIDLKDMSSARRRL